MAKLPKAKTDARASKRREIPCDMAVPPYLPGMPWVWRRRTLTSRPRCPERYSRQGLLLHRCRWRAARQQPSTQGTANLVLELDVHPVHKALGHIIQLI